LALSSDVKKEVGRLQTVSNYCIKEIVCSQRDDSLSRLSPSLLDVFLILDVIYFSLHSFVSQVSEQE
jgi:hypothetical protein